MLKHFALKMAQSPNLSPIKNMWHNLKIAFDSSLSHGHWASFQSKTKNKFAFKMCKAGNDKAKRVISM